MPPKQIHLRPRRRKATAKPVRRPRANELPAQPVMFWVVDGKVRPALPGAFGDADGKTLLTIDQASERTKLDAHVLRKIWRDEYGELESPRITKVLGPATPRPGRTVVGAGTPSIGAGNPLDADMFFVLEAGTLVPKLPAPDRLPDGVNVFTLEQARARFNLPVERLRALWNAQWREFVMPHLAPPAQIIFERTVIGGEERLIPRFPWHQRVERGPARQPDGRRFLSLTAAAREMEEPPLAMVRDWLDTWGDFLTPDERDEVLTHSQAVTESTNPAAGREPTAISHPSEVPCTAKQRRRRSRRESTRG